MGKMIGRGIPNILLFIVHGLGTVSEGLLPFLAPVLDLSIDLTQESHIYLLEVFYLFTSSRSIYRSYTGVPYISIRGSISIYQFWIYLLILHRSLMINECRQFLLYRKIP